jgi:hypothetical protein
MTDRDAAYRTTLSDLRADYAECEARMKKIAGAISAIEDMITSPNGNGVARAARPVNRIVQGEMYADPRVATAPTMWQAAEVILRDLGKPTGWREIMRLMKARGFPYDRNDETFRLSLVPGLNRKAVKGEVFTRPMPGVYGLIEWNNNAE